MSVQFDSIQLSPSAHKGTIMTCFDRCPAGTVAILAEIIRGFPQSFHAIARLISQIRPLFTIILQLNVISVVLRKILFSMRKVVRKVIRIERLK